MIFFILVFITGFAGALRLPTLSPFLYNEVTDDPLKVGVFYSVNSLIAMALSQVVAHYSDRYPNRKQIIMFSCFMQILGCLLFAFNRDYYLLLTLGTLIVGLGASATSQIFAFAREQRIRQRQDSAMFSSLLRAQLSLAWVIGPPIAYFVSAHWGFAAMYLSAAVIFLISLLLATFFLPQAVTLNAKNTDTSKRNRDKPGDYRSIIFLFLACLLALTCNSMMFINLPIYLTETLSLDKSLAGTMMGLAAGIEIPVMIIVGWLGKYLSKKNLMLISLFFGICYYIGLNTAQLPWQFLALQLFNGIFIGILASIGMLYFQDLLPHKMGTATTLFNNTGSASWITAGPIAGIIAQQFGYSSTWHWAVAFSSLALLLMLPVKNP